MVGSIADDPLNAIAINTNRLRAMIALVTGICSRAPDWRERSGADDCARCTIAARHSGQMLWGSLGEGNSRPQLMQVGMI